MFHPRPQTRTEQRTKYKKTLVRAMPHRINAKADIGSLKRFSDTYDMDNVYLSEEGWIYRHFKNSERTLWWDEILVAGQVKPGMEIHDVNNNPVVPTNPYKLGTAGDPLDGAKDVGAPTYLAFEHGDGYPDYRYSDHQRVDQGKVTTYGASGADLIDRSDFEETAWESINVPTPIEGDLSTQVPQGWNGTSDESAEVDPATGVRKYQDQPPYPGEEYQNINHYTTENPNYVPLEKLYTTPMTTPAVQPGEFDLGSGPAEIDKDYTADNDAYGDAPSTPGGDGNLGPDADSNGQTPAQPIVP